jgi:serine/threonine-protein kinase
VTPERWKQVNELFHAALEQPADAREAYIQRSASSDADLQREVLSLLRSHRNSGYLDRPAWAVAADLLRDDEPSRVGETVGKYRIVRPIASGGMGVVYQATDEVLGRSVALKALPAEYAQDKTRRDRLAREAKLAAQISHRAVATVYELVEADGQLYIASEYVPGITLRRELEDGPLPAAHLLGTLAEIAAALAAAHAHNIIHRDLKPENIVRREDGQIKVLDFGLARTVSDPGGPTSTRFTEAGIVAGTPGYIAPEVLNSREPDARSDIFVFGLLAWELATGRHPLGANAHSQMARLHDITAGAEPSLTGSLPVPGLETVLRQCLRRLPDERYASAVLLLNDLRSLQHSRPATQPTPPAESPMWWWRFHQGTMAGVDVTTPVFAWVVREMIGRPLGTWIFYAVLALATAAVTLRLNLVFTSRVHSRMLPHHHASLYRWILGAEAGLAMLLLSIALVIGHDHEAYAALFISLAIVIAASLAIIEPTTTRGAGLGNR